MLEVIDDFLWTLRREGFAISPAEARDAVSVVREVGFADPVMLRDALACVVVARAGSAPRYRALFAAFFGSSKPRHPALDERLRAQGFSEAELVVLRAALAELLASERGGRASSLLSGDAGIDHLLTTEGVLHWLARVKSTVQAGFYAHRVFDALGLARARSTQSMLREALVEALGVVRGSALAAAVADELVRVERHVRQALDRRATSAEDAERAPRDARRTPFGALSDSQTEDVRRGVRALAEKLAAAARVRRRHARRGRIDAGRTMRESYRTGGVPFRPIRVDRRRDKPRLVLLCDVSDSVRAASRFMLEFVHAMHELFESTRCFVFVDDLIEVTALLGESDMSTALTHTSATFATGNSNYGRVLQRFEQRHGAVMDRRTTLVVMGDGRTNYLANGAPALRRLRARVKDVLWLCPEPQSLWGQGDSAMPHYAAQVTQVVVAANAEGLERAAREIVRRTR